MKIEYIIAISLIMLIFFVVKKISKKKTKTKRPSKDSYPLW